MINKGSQLAGQKMTTLLLCASISELGRSYAKRFEFILDPRFSEMISSAI